MSCHTPSLCVQQKEIPIEFKRLLESHFRIQIIFELVQSDAKQSIRRRKRLVEVDGSRKVMESTRMLIHSQVNKPEIEDNNPLKRRQVRRMLETGYGLGDMSSQQSMERYTHRNVFLLAKEAHADVVPDLGRLGRFD